MALSNTATGSAVRQRVIVWKKPKDGCSGKFFSLRKKGNSSRTFLRKHWNLPTVLLMNTSGAAVKGLPAGFIHDISLF